MQNKDIWSCIPPEILPVLNTADRYLVMPADSKGLWLIHFGCDHTRLGVTLGNHLLQATGQRLAPENPAIEKIESKWLGSCLGIWQGRESSAISLIAVRGPLPLEPNVTCSYSGLFWSWRALVLIASTPVYLDGVLSVILLSFLTSLQSRIIAWMHT